MNDSIWTDARVAHLLELWPSQMSLAKIGRAIGAGKNAVIGKGRRMKLPPRPAIDRPKMSLEQKMAANRSKQARYDAKKQAERLASGQVIRTRRKQSAAVAGSPVGPVREAAYHTIAQWAEGYGLPVSPTHGFDLAGINAFRAQHGLAPFAIRRAAGTKNSFAYGAQQR